MQPEPSDTLRFAALTDIHYGFDRGNKLGSEAPELLKDFVKAANAAKVGFVAELGDRVSSESAELDAYYQRKVSRRFNDLAVPRYSVDGNNDIYRLPPAPSHVQRSGNTTLIFWNPNLDARPKGGLTLRPEDLEWLANALADAPGQAILFSHVPLDNNKRDYLDALKADKKPFKSFYPQGAQVRAMLERSGKVFLCVHGHRHCNRQREINGIHYVTLDSFVQKNEPTGKAAGAYFIFDIDNQHIGIKAFGRGQQSTTLIRINTNQPQPQVA